MIKNRLETEMKEKATTLSIEKYKKNVLADYEWAVVSRETSLLGRREVLTGKAKFGIFGDGKEVPQLALARAMRKGDWRSGYYRDQTLMLALGISTIEQFFAQLYADNENDPFSGGRQMNAHFATPTVDKTTGNWANHRDRINVSSDISCTAGQMPRAFGLAVASQKYKKIASISNSTSFSEDGNELSIVTIGDASTSEGAFWETMNAAAVRQVPLACVVWDDGYGISVPKEHQTAKSSISQALRGFERTETESGIDIYVCNGWDYEALCEMFETGLGQMRQNSRPALFHVENLTQPQGHSTSGSHERYKTKERLDWEKAQDCNLKMREWIIEQNICSEPELEQLELRAKARARDAKTRAWNDYFSPIKAAQTFLLTHFPALIAENPHVATEISALEAEMKAMREPFYGELVKIMRQAVLILGGGHSEAFRAVENWLNTTKEKAKKYYNSNLYSDSPYAAINISTIAPTYSEKSIERNGYEILNTFFDKTFEKNPYVLAFGEDVGYIGDVNQGFAGLQAKHGADRIYDCGIREWTIMGEAIGLAMRGFRPIAEIQYLDYLLYGLSPLSDDLATVRYRSNGIQQAPAIIRTRGHRLEGIWHAGSPMGLLLGSLRGMYICMPRNMVQAVGFYNTLLQSDDPALVVECLNGYRLKERQPDNLGDYSVPLGVPEVLTQGNDITIVTYGSCVRVAQDAISFLEKRNISVELIDIQTLLPFDVNGMIADSLKKTNRVLFLDEDVPGGATAFMMQEVLEKQGAYRFLDAKPRTLSAQPHRTPYGSDGDYFSKPNVEDVIELILEITQE